jgi:hypothetical protein
MLKLIDDKLYQLAENKGKATAASLNFYKRRVV